MEPSHVEGPAFDADCYFPSVQGGKVQAGVVGGLDEYDDSDWRMHEVDDTVALRLAVYDSLSRVEVDADDGG